jgi:hypothetical protein
MREEADADRPQEVRSSEKTSTLTNPEKSSGTPAPSLLVGAWKRRGTERDSRSSQEGDRRESTWAKEAFFMSTGDPPRALVALLDTGPLGMITNPKGGREAAECKDWLAHILSIGVLVLVPAIADYELRRELIRSRKVEGLARLDSLISTLGHVPIDQDVLNEAAEIWAKARQTGVPTAPDLALDGDCILAAQSWNVHKVLFLDNVIEFDSVIATTNPDHLGRFAEARHWRDIQ